MAVLDGHHAAADPTDPVGSALGKIVQALPAPVAAQAEAVRRATSPAPDRSAARPDPSTTSTLVQACSDRRRVRLAYLSEAGSQWDAEVDPWAVVVRHGRWYLLCHSYRPGAVRAYRVDRIGEVTVLGATFTPPPRLDPVALLEDHLSLGWEYDVEVVLEAPAEEVRVWLPRSLGRLEAVGARSCRLVASTSNPRWYAAQLAELPAPYRIVAGPELRAAARAVGQRLLDASAG
jgi:predicted DNA-binding transcriptional regulator YafY